MPLCRPEQALKYPILRIDNPQVQAILNLDTKEKRFSLEDLRPKMDELERQAQRASDTPASRRDVVDRKILELYQKISLYTNVSQWSRTVFSAARRGGRARGGRFMKS